MKIKTIILISSFAPCIWAKNFIPSSSTFNYRIGGSSSLSVPAVSNVHKYRLGVSAHSNIFPTCGNFSPTFTIKNSLNNLKSSFVGLPTQAVQNMTYAVKGYVLAKTQQALPGIFDALKHQSLFAGDEFKIKIKRCEEVQKQVSQGGSPFDGLIQISDSQGWVDAATRAAGNNPDVDITKEDKKITKYSEEYGLPWLHHDQHYAGGKDQPPIKVIEDIVKAGFNLLAHPGVNVSLDSDDAIGLDNKDVNFARFWQKPSDAATWAKTVLGDLTFSKDESKKETQSGIGLSAVLHSCPHITKNGNTCPSNVSDYLWELVQGKSEATSENLQKLSTSNMVITSDVISTIQLLPREEQIIAVSKLSEDIAIQNLVEEALSLRRILIAGYQIQQVQNLKPIRQMVKGSIDLLDSEIKSLAFENNIRSQLANKTLKTISDIRQEMLSKTNSSNDGEDDALNNGAIYKKNEKQGVLR